MKRSIPIFLFTLLSFIVVACVPAQTQSGLEPENTASVEAAPRGTVAALRASPPAAGEGVEIDAYFAGAFARSYPMPEPDDGEEICPHFQDKLTDQPFLPSLTFLNGISSNSLSEDAAWLLATTTEAKEQPGRYVELDLPFHGRLRGHLGDPAFAHCPNAERIFVVESVVQAYDEQPPEQPSGSQLQLPADFATWPRYQDEALGFSLPHPPDWQVVSLDDAPDGTEAHAPQKLLGGIAVRSDQWPTHPLIVHVYDGGMAQEDLTSDVQPALLEGDSWSVYEQGFSLQEDAIPGSEQLNGYKVDRRSEPGARVQAIVFPGNGVTYEIVVRYPTGFEASQELLTNFSATIEGFRLNHATNSATE